MRDIPEKVKKTFHRIAPKSPSIDFCNEFARLGTHLRQPRKSAASPASPEVVSSSAVWSLRSTRAGGQDDGSSNKLPQTISSYLGSIFVPFRTRAHIGPAPILAPGSFWNQHGTRMSQIGPQYLTPKVISLLSSTAFAHRFTVLSLATIPMASKKNWIKAKT